MKKKKGQTKISSWPNGLSSFTSFFSSLSSAIQGYFAKSILQVMVDSLTLYRLQDKLELSFCLMEVGVLFQGIQIHSLQTKKRNEMCSIPCADKGHGQENQGPRCGAVTE